jgi:16S rRNA C967 or C1407 C5-methylase (RsmB/RsmF family)/NOL1/NOP2/fmu family ribosome biogenesis protein
MFPEEFRRRIKLQQYIDSDSLIEGLRAPVPVSIRTNPAKCKYQPLNSEPVPWCESGFYLDKRPSFTLDPLFHGGAYYPQEASGMFLEEVFKQVMRGSDSLKVLDLCGAPGGKSTHLSSLIGGKGLLVANEVIRQRAFILAENVTKWGLSNTLVTQNDPSAFAEIPGFFDIVLVDAPCSGEGMFGNPETVKEWSVENTMLNSERQKRILMDVWPALKEDGILIYSTCTFNPDENEKNIKWFLQRKNAKSVRLDIADYEGITEVDYEGIHGYGFYPGRIKGEGLFISVIRKTEKTELVKSSFKTGKRLAPDREEIQKATELSSFPDDTFIKINDDIISVPGSYSDYRILEGKLRIFKHGTKICSVKAKNYIPSHEIALSVNFKLNVFYTLKVGYEQTLSFLRKDNLPAGDTPRGWILVSYNGINLGFMKNVGNRINNYYPIGWRVRMRSPDKGNENLILWGGI